MNQSLSLGLLVVVLQFTAIGQFKYHGSFTPRSEDVSRDMVSEIVQAIRQQDMGRMMASLSLEAKPQVIERIAIFFKTMNRGLSKSGTIDFYAEVRSNRMVSDTLDCVFSCGFSSNSVGKSRSIVMTFAKNDGQWKIVNPETIVDEIVRIKGRSELTI